MTEPHTFISSGVAAADCTFEGLRKSMRELEEKFPGGPPLERIRVTQWLLDALKERLMPPPSGMEVAAWPFDATHLHGVPIVADLPASHRPGWEPVYRRAPAPPGCEFLDATHIRAQARKQMEAWGIPPERADAVFDAAPSVGLEPVGLELLCSTQATPLPFEFSLSGIDWFGNLFAIPPSTLAETPQRVTATEIGMRIADEQRMEGVRKQMKAWQHQATIEAMEAPIDDIDPARRRQYLQRMYRLPYYRNGSRRRKMQLRRALLAERVARY